MQSCLLTRNIFYLYRTEKEQWGLSDSSCHYPISQEPGFCNHETACKPHSGSSLQIKITFKLITSKSLKIFCVPCHQIRFRRTLLLTVDIPWTKMSSLWVLSPTMSLDMCIEMFLSWFAKLAEDVAAQGSWQGWSSLADSEKSSAIVLSSGTSLLKVKFIRTHMYLHLVWQTKHIFFSIISDKVTWVGLKIKYLN